MKKRPWLTAGLIVSVVLATAQAAQANSVSISPYVYFLPGVLPFSLLFAFPASLLAAVCERPFLTAGGLRERTLARSLQANFISTVVAILLLPVGSPALDLLGPYWCLFAFALSCLVEGCYLRRFAPTLRNRSRLGKQ